MGCRSVPNLMALNDVEPPYRNTLRYVITFLGAICVEANEDIAPRYQR